MNRKITIHKHHDGIMEDMGTGKISDPPHIHGLEADLETDAYKKIEIASIHFDHGKITADNGTIYSYDIE